MNDYTSPADESFFAAIGRLTLSWAHLEFGLDAAISIIHQRLDGSSIDPEVPIHIGRKVRYLKRALRRLPPLALYAESMLPILQAIADAVEFRKDIVHGAVIQHTSGASEANLMRLLHDKGGQHQEKPVPVSTTSILQAANDANKLAHKALVFASELIERFLK